MLFIVNTSIRKIKKIPTWSLVIINQLIHDLTIVIQCGGAAAVQVEGFHGAQVQPFQARIGLVDAVQDQVRFIIQ